MIRTYANYMKEIDANQLFEGLLGYGLFAEKIPPVFTSKPFFEWCLDKDEEVFSCKKSRKNNVDWEYFGKDYIRYDNMRNINIPRPLSIPHPIAYRNFCKSLSDNWGDIQEYFYKKTENQSHKVSRIHIRNMSNRKYLFDMSYRNFKKDDLDVEASLSINSRFIVKADISNCFPSIYTHSIAWAIIGKDQSKNNRSNSFYYNDVDRFTRNLKHGETHGILIGPHGSNVISEIILTAIDEKINEKGYKYIRNIDDYTCYVDSHENAEEFLLDLSLELKKFELTLNHKKTEILDLPLASIANWVRKMNNFFFLNKKTKDGRLIMTYKELKSYLDLSIELMQENKNTAIINYAIKVISKKYLNEHTKIYYLKRIHHLILIYPYLITLLDEYIFEPLSISKSDIEEISNNIFKMGVQKNKQEAISYSVFFALKHNLKINEDDLFKIGKKNDDCILLLLLFLYEKRNNNEVNKYINLAKMKNKNENDFHKFWVFIYEVLDHNFLNKPFNKSFKLMKDDEISFCKGDFL